VFAVPAQKARQVTCLTLKNKAQRLPLPLVEFRALIEPLKNFLRDFEARFLREQSFIILFEGHMLIQQANPGWASLDGQRAKNRRKDRVRPK